MVWSVVWVSFAWSADQRIDVGSIHTPPSINPAQPKRDRGFSCIWMPLSSNTIDYAAGIGRRQRSSTGSLRRNLNRGPQALLGQAYQRKGRYRGGAPQGGVACRWNC